MLRAASAADGGPVVTVLAGGQPIPGADILVLFPNQTWKRALTGEHGEAVLDLHAVHLPMTVFVAADGFSAHLERGWTPAERPLHVELNALPGGGAVIFPEGAGPIPGLAPVGHPGAVSATARLDHISIAISNERTRAS